MNAARSLPELKLVSQGERFRRSDGFGVTGGTEIMSPRNLAVGAKEIATVTRDHLFRLFRESGGIKDEWRGSRGTHLDRLRPILGDTRLHTPRASHPTRESYGCNLSELCQVTIFRGWYCAPSGSKCYKRRILE